MIVVSMCLNILVLVPVVVSLITRAAWTRTAFGERTPARDILLAIYGAILVASIVLLAGVIASPSSIALLGAVCSLLFAQVIYKAPTAVTVSKSLSNPVVLSNIAIAAVHVVTLTVTIPTLFDSGNVG